MQKPSPTQAISAAALSLCAYFAKYEFEGIKTEQAEMRAEIKQVSQTTNTNQTLLIQVLEKDRLRMRNYSSK